MEGLTKRLRDIFWVEFSKEVETLSKTKEYAEKVNNHLKNKNCNTNNILWVNDKTWHDKYKDKYRQIRIINNSKCIFWASIIIPLLLNLINKIMFDMIYTTISFALIGSVLCSTVCLIAIAVMLKDIYKNFKNRKNEL